MHARTLPFQHCSHDTNKLVCYSRKGDRLPPIIIPLSWVLYDSDEGGGRGGEASSYFVRQIWRDVYCETADFILFDRFRNSFYGMT